MANAKPAEALRGDERDDLIRALYDASVRTEAGDAPDFATFRAVVLDAIQAVFGGLSPLHRAPFRPSQVAEPPLTEADMLNRAETRRLLRETNLVMDEVERLIAAL